MLPHHLSRIEKQLLRWGNSQCMLDRMEPRRLVNYYYHIKSIRAQRDTQIEKTPIVMFKK
jgi:hypothetical protein